jgi:undecaprenyl-diphosphatase
MIYGLFQCLALIPGVSRSGITMTAGRFMGHSRVEAARFSLLLGMVAIAGAGLLTGLSLISGAAMYDGFLTMLSVGMAVSCVSAYIAIWLMMRWVSKSTFTPFVIYRIVLGTALLILLYSDIIPNNMQG